MLVIHSTDVSVTKCKQLKISGLCGCSSSQTSGVGSACADEEGSQSFTLVLVVERHILTCVIHWTYQAQAYRVVGNRTSALLLFDAHCGCIHLDTDRRPPV